MKITGFLYSFNYGTGVDGIDIVRKKSRFILVRPGVLGSDDILVI